MAERDGALELPAEKIEGDVSFEHVGFRYGESGEPTLRGIDLRVPAGPTLALVGETGSGKTTLAYLLARLYDVDEGAVKVDGFDVRELSHGSLAGIVGLVSQETYPFHASVRENLRFARPEATDEEVEDAARAAQIHGLIAGLSDGFDTVVGERGYRFSGGEKQRIAIARAVLRNPPSSSTRPPARSTPRPSERSARRSVISRVGGRQWPSPTGSRPSTTPTRSPCSTAARSWSSERTRSSWTAAGATRRSWRGSGGPRRRWQSELVRPRRRGQPRCPPRPSGTAPPGLGEVRPEARRTCRPTHLKERRRRAVGGVDLRVALSAACWRPGVRIPLRSEEVAVTLLLIGIFAWVLLAVFVCSLGRAAKAGDRLERERVPGWVDLGLGR